MEHTWKCKECTRGYVMHHEPDKREVHLEFIKRHRIGSGGACDNAVSIDDIEEVREAAQGI